MIRALSVIAVFGAIGCQSGLEDERPLPALDEPFFRCRVQPVLTKTCSTFACHGDARRYYNVFARNRLRAQGMEKDRNAPLSLLERASNFEAARAFVQDSDPRASWLLLKTLEQGGYFHRGARIFGGGNVFANREDPDFKVIEAWTLGTKEDAACIEPGSDQ